MNEKPIIFSDESVRAILAGRKTQTRRVVRPQPIVEPDGRMHWKGIGWTYHYERLTHGTMLSKCPYGVPGDRLWVREKLARVEGGIVYAGFISDKPLRWMSPIHMPRAYSRLTLEIVNIRVKRLQEISEEDAVAEGLERDEAGFWFTKTSAPKDMYFNKNPKSIYAVLWDDINAKRGYPWASNPWVWVIEFGKVEDE